MSSTSNQRISKLNNVKLLFRGAYLSVVSFDSEIWCFITFKFNSCVMWQIVLSKQSCIKSATIAYLLIVLILSEEQIHETFYNKNRQKQTLRTYTFVVSFTLYLYLQFTTAVSMLTNGSKLENQTLLISKNYHFDKDV